ncbi:MAG: tRNA (adenosine(37)-N6)-threonylcarbamoyltransferase complex dimerization subunit type 1 TsaB [Firmicutes bacterium]|nr:tRNA (adenosine(37)-N6)-threonylcarbamoyltransferase complex dimerization subunit type 1 TsaB [Bacillota bacterium]
MNLFIDTHLNDVRIILFENNQIIKERIIEGEQQNSKLIMPIIKKVLDKRIPETIIVVNGPGSFTGVRLGVTIAKTLAYTMKIPIRTITALECLALSTEEPEKIVAFNDKNGYYIGIFNEDYELIGNYEYLTNSEFNEFSQKYNVLSDIKVDYEKVIGYASSKEPTNAHEVNPVYIKKIDVEK